MVSGVYTRNSGGKMKVAKSKKHSFYKYVSKNIFFIIAIVILILFVVIVLLLNLATYNFDSKDAVHIVKVSFGFTLMGILFGCFLSIIGSAWYRKKISMIQNYEDIKNYSRIIKADIERTSRLFRNKRFNFIKISSVTILKNWIDAFSRISSKLTKDELQELFDYYCQIDKLLDYEIRINKHLEVMQCCALKDYPYMKEYNQLIKCFSIEVNALFKIDITLLKMRLKLLCI